MKITFVVCYVPCLLALRLLIFWLWFELDLDLDWVL